MLTKTSEFHRRAKAGLGQVRLSERGTPAAPYGKIVSGSLSYSRGPEGAKDQAAAIRLNRYAAAEGGSFVSWRRSMRRLSSFKFSAKI